MNKNLNRQFALFLSILLAVLVFPAGSFAAGKIETDRPAALTVSFTDEGKAIPGAKFRVYKVADVDAYGELTLTETFAGYKNTVEGLTAMETLTEEQWVTLAATLKGYVIRDEVRPAAEGITDAEGNIAFPELTVGLYLVVGTRATTDDFYTYTPVPFMVLLPGRDSVNNDWLYELTAIPKFTKEYYPPAEEGDDYITRKVLKIWEDEGCEELRPEEIVVQLLRNGEVYDTQTLNEANFWRYAWDNLDADYEWEVVELPVEGYTVSLSRSGITFIVENKYLVPAISEDPPVQKLITGDKPESASTFTFVLKAKDPSFPMPEGSSGSEKEIKITGVGSKEFGRIVFTKPGTYVYTVHEKKGSVKGYTYDSKVYTIRYVVEEVDGELLISADLEDDQGNLCAGIEFTNQYKTPGKDLPDTGVVWWPVPVLLFCGLVFIMAGIIRRRKGS